MENYEIEKEEFVRNLCASCNASNVYCTNKCDIATYAENRYEKCAIKTEKEFNGDMDKTFKYIKNHLIKKYA